MLDPCRRTTLGRLADVALLATFLILSIFAYGALFIGAGRAITAPAPSEFADFYQPGQNPWSGAIAEPVAPQERFASTTPAKAGYR
jgi:hypothetical protein